MNSFQPRQPAGSPSGGQFSGKYRAESDIELDVGVPDEDRWNKPGYELDRDDILEWGQDGLQDDSLFDNYFSNPKIPIEERWDTLESFAKSADLAALEERTWSGGEETGADLLEWALLRAKKDARLRGHMQSFLHEREDIHDQIVQQREDAAFEYPGETLTFIISEVAGLPDE